MVSVGSSVSVQEKSFISEVRSIEGKMKSAALIILTALFAAVIAQKPWEPTPRSESWWHDRHKMFMDRTANLGSQIKVVFLGSSIMEYWGREGKPVWDQHYAPVGAYNYGIGGDRTEHVLWRIQQGELNGLTGCKLVVVYIGSNNVPHNSNNDEIVRGVNTVIDKVHEKLPNANILLVGTFPRADQSDVRGTLQRIRYIDEKLDDLVGGDTSRKSHFIDLFFKLAPPSLDRIYTELYISDKLHLNIDGYRMWQREMNTIFNQLIR